VYKSPGVDPSTEKYPRRRLVQNLSNNVRWFSQIFRQVSVPSPTLNIQSPLPRQHQQKATNQSRYHIIAFSHSTRTLAHYDPSRRWRALSVFRFWTRLADYPLSFPFNPPIRMYDITTHPLSSPSALFDTSFVSFILCHDNHPILMIPTIPYRYLLRLCC